MKPLAKALCAIAGNTSIEKNDTTDFEKPLSTNGPLSKDQLIEYLQKADIPGDAECTLQFDEGKFYLYFYWSEGEGAFGHTAVNFDIESKELVEDAWNYMEED